MNKKYKYKIVNKFCTASYSEAYCTTLQQAKKQLKMLQEIDFKLYGNRTDKPVYTIERI